MGSRLIRPATAIRRPILAALLAVLLFCWAGAAPARAFVFGGVTLKDEKEMGRKFDVMVRSRLPVIDDPEIRLYVESVVNRLVRAIPPQPFTFTSGVIQHSTLNAFAVPGGYVYVFSGLIMNLEHEGELAGVLAHELAHVTQRHVASRMQKAQAVTVASLLLAVAGVVAGGPAGGAAVAGAVGAGQSIMLSHSRADELESDQLGLQYLVAAGYPPSGMAGGFRMLRRKHWMSGSSIPAYLSTHPDLGDRVNGIEARVAKLPAAIRSRKHDDARFRRVQTLLWGRHGEEQAALRRFAGKDALSCVGRGLVLSRRNDVAGARRAFDEAVAAAPNDPLVLREAGIFHYRKGDQDRAEKLLAAAARRDPRDCMTIFYRARLLDESGRAAQAEPHYRDVLRHLPEDAEVHEAFARSLGRTGRTLDAHIHMAYAAIYSQNRDLAKRHVERARALAGKSGGGRALARLEDVYKERKEIWDK